MLPQLLKCADRGAANIALNTGIPLGCDRVGLIGEEEKGTEADRAEVERAEEMVLLLIARDVFRAAAPDINNKLTAEIFPIARIPFRYPTLK
jgi:hypothetical protein